MIKQWVKMNIRRVFNYGMVDYGNYFNVLDQNIRYEARRQQLIEHILHDKESGVSAERYANHDIIVSLTTFSKRIHDVAFTIESIMQQSMKPNRIVLYIDDCIQETSLPQSLLNQQKRGLEIEKTANIRAYKKIIPQLKRTPGDAIITIDDDALYEYDMLEHLIKAYQESPQMIHCCRAHKMEFGNDGKLIPYIQWKPQTMVGASKYNFLTGVGGVLYPPHSLDTEVLNESVFTNICKYNDDIWLVAMALKKGTLINKVYTRDKEGVDFLTNWSVQDIGLYHTNVEQNQNDSQIDAVFSKYSLYDIFM